MLAVEGYLQGLPPSCYVLTLCKMYTRSDRKNSEHNHDNVVLADILTLNKQIKHVMLFAMGFKYSITIWFLSNFWFEGWNYQA